MRVTIQDKALKIEVKEIRDPSCPVGLLLVAADGWIRTRLTTEEAQCLGNALCAIAREATI